MKKILILLLILFTSSCIAYSALPDNYNINDQDESGSVTKYYGYTKKSSDWWVIMRSSTTASVSQYRYAIGYSDYSTEWTNRSAADYYDWADTYANPN